MKLIKYFFAVVTAMLVFASCNEDLDVIEKEKPTPPSVPKTKVTVNFESLKGFENVNYSDVTVVFTELNTQQKKTFKVEKFPTLEVELIQGSYEISVTGNVKYTLDGVQKDGKVGAFINELNFTKDIESINIQLILKAFSNDFIIEEIFFAGTRTLQSKSYFGDTYIKLYNNTDKVLYADGLLIAHSSILTDEEYTYGDILSKAFLASGVFQIPGNGKDYPIQPGKSIIIAEDGINHKENNSNSFDLSKADFEKFFDNNDDKDSPTVKNLNILYDYAIVNNSGRQGFVIARLPKDVTKENFLADYTYEYKSDQTEDYGGGFILPKDQGDTMKILNTWIIDAVNVTVKNDFKKIVTDPSLDSGWTYCAETKEDGMRFGNAIRRKVLQEVEGKRILKDTNNSINDFEPRVRPSLMK